MINTYSASHGLIKLEAQYYICQSAAQGAVAVVEISVPCQCEPAMVYVEADPSFVKYSFV